MNESYQRIGIGDRSTSSWLNVVVTPQFGLQSEVFLMVRSVRHSQGSIPPHCTISCYDCILRQCSQIAVTTAISRNIADPSLLKFSRWDIVMWPWRRQPGNSELPSPPALWSAGSLTSRPLPHTGRITSLPNHTLFARYSIYNPYSLSLILHSYRIYVNRALKRTGNYPTVEALVRLFLSAKCYNWAISSSNWFISNVFISNSQMSSESNGNALVDVMSAHCAVRTLYGERAKG
jgi:hypothetical protein